MIGILLAGCANTPRQGYAGPALSDAETALIQVSSIEHAVASTDPPGTIGLRADRPQSRFSIVEIDGENLDAYEVRVLPGGKCVTLRILEGISQGNNSPFLVVSSTDSDLCFEAVAGTTYEARYGFPSAQSSMIWLVDMMTGRTLTEQVVNAP
ncbi:MAG: hypothetical protein ACR2QQ_06530 [Gammaproteobacteria bacterium]